MTGNEIKFYIGDESHLAFLQPGFYGATASVKARHKHNYTEIHIISEHGCTFFYNGRRNKISAGTMLVIPSGVIHEYSYEEAPLSHIAFQTDLKSESISMYPLNDGMISAFKSAIQEACCNVDHTKVAAFITLFCSYFTDKRILAQKITDYSFIIREFFSIRYSEDVSLSDLASQLCTSDRHAERLVISFTGHSFRDELTRVRMSVARQLIEEGEMSLREIAEYVGYRSYSGFWKVMRKQGYK